MEEMILSEEQYKVLDDIGVFDKINEKCDIIIDDYEEEVLELDKIPMALEIVNQLINSNSNEELVKLKKCWIWRLHIKQQSDLIFKIRQ